MTNFIQTRSFDQRNGQGGFAIGLILLVVLLIAVIVGAIAIASRSSSNSGGQEKDRVAASSLITQAQGLNNAVTRAIDGAGATPTDLFMSYATTGTYRTSPANLIGQSGYLTAPTINAQAYSANATTTACPANNIPTDTSPSCVFILSRIALGSSGGDSLVVYTKPLSDTVARQVNAVLWSASPNVTALPLLVGNAPAEDITAGGWGKANPNSAGAGTFLTQATTAPGVTAGSVTTWNGVKTTAASGTGATAVAASSSSGLTGSQLPIINGTNRAEGAFNANVAASGNVYYRVLNNL